MVAGAKQKVELEQALAATYTHKVWGSHRRWFNLYTVKYCPFLNEKNKNAALKEMISISGFLHCVRKSSKVLPTKFGKNYISR